ncbi:hypothetical protein Ocin01_11609 [Orchesella cincta]|uniref:Uncharacterized protein n=1 Tax=Orchesella cincta TaxID=48709 RepID=A0A1D2MPU4_ORCCI|nr:hypothetical protein Ocin01_11609 [Orchesella cincta]
MRCAILSVNVSNNPVNNRLSGTIKVSGLPEDVPFRTKFPEAVTKFDSCSSLHEIMPVICSMLNFLDDHGYKIISSTNVTGFRSGQSGETFLIWNLGIP